MDLPDNYKAVVSNRPFRAEQSMALALRNDVVVHGDLLQLYHGTRQSNKIVSGTIIRTGFWLASSIEIAQRYAQAAQARGKAAVMTFLVPAGALYPTGSRDGAYFSTTEPLKLDSSGVLNYIYPSGPSAEDLIERLFT